MHDLIQVVVTAIVSAIVSVVISFASVWANQKVIFEKLNNMNESMVRIEKRVDRVFDDFYTPKDKNGS